MILDFDGTLADSGPWVWGVARELALRFGQPALTEAEVPALRGRDTRAVLRRLGIPAWRLPGLAREVRARMARDADAIRLFPGVPEALEQLRADGAVLAVASSNAEGTVRAVLGASTATVEWFECGTALFGKAARFRRVLRRAGVAAGNALCVGDELRDAEAARRAGIAFAGVAWGYATPAALLAQHPAHLFRTPAELGRVAFGMPCPDGGVR